MDRSKQTCDVIICLFGVGVALITLFVWIPRDIDTGVIDVWRRSVRIGDAMLPTFAALIILGSSIMVGLRALIGKASGGTRPMSPAYCGMVFAVLAVSIAIMWSAGPALVWMWFSGEMSYRTLLDTAPWKYTGFILGGAFLISGLIALAQHRLRLRDLGIAIVASCVIALLYDLPFDNLFLPPNGEF